MVYMKLPEKIKAPTMTTTSSPEVIVCPLNQEAQKINQLIDYLEEREAIEQMSGVPDMVMGNMPTPLFGAKDIGVAYHDIWGYCITGFKSPQETSQAIEALLKLTK